MEATAFGHCGKNKKPRAQVMHTTTANMFLGGIICRLCPAASVQRQKFPLVLSDLQELEKLASRKLRISAKETMKIAEKLYTQG